MCLFAFHLTRSSRALMYVLLKALSTNFSSFVLIMFVSQRFNDIPIATVPQPFEHLSQQGFAFIFIFGAAHLCHLLHNSIVRWTAFMTAPCSTYQGNSEAYNNGFCADNVSTSFFPWPTCRCPGCTVILHVLQHGFVMDLLVVEERRDFFKLCRQRFSSLRAHFHKSNPSSCF